MRLSVYACQWPSCLPKTGMLCNLFLLTYLSVGLSQAQSQVTSDGTLGTEINRSDSLYSITGGTRPSHSQNLFHSFDQFNVGTGDTARFASDLGVDNIIGRVTGGEISMIDGTLHAEANLFLLNPQGIVFGPSATLDVNGSFHASTAEVMRFENGAVFSAHLNEASTLTIAEPAAFGFLRENPAGLSIEGRILEVPEGATLSMIGGEVEMRGGTLRAPSGRIDVVSAASSGDVMSQTSGEALAPQVVGIERFGKVTLSQNAFIDASGAPGGGQWRSEGDTCCSMRRMLLPARWEIQTASRLPLMSWQRGICS